MSTSWRRSVGRANHIVSFAALLVLLPAGVGRASVLNVDLVFYPDINSSPVYISYDAQSHAYQVRGTGIFQYLPDADPSHVMDVYKGTFLLTAKIDNAGELEADPGNSLSVSGRIPDLGLPLGSLLQGTLTAFGFTGATDTRQQLFLFDITGGALADEYGPEGALRITTSSFPGFSNSFSNLVAMADTDPPVPEPQAWMVWGVLTTAAGFLIRRAKSTH